jgi:hypothetical protein
VYRPRPGVRLRDIAASVGVTDLTAAGYIVKHKDGRRDRYQTQAHRLLPEPHSQALGRTASPGPVPQAPEAGVPAVGGLQR